MSVQGDKESKFGSNGKIFISSSLSGCEPTDRKSQALAEFKKKKKKTMLIANQSFWRHHKT